MSSQENYRIDDIDFYAIEKYLNEDLIELIFEERVDYCSVLYQDKETKMPYIQSIYDKNKKEYSYYMYEDIPESRRVPPKKQLILDTPEEVKQVQIAIMEAKVKELFTDLDIALKREFHTRARILIQAIRSSDVSLEEGFKKIELEIRKVEDPREREFFSLVVHMELLKDD